MHKKDDIVKIYDDMFNLIGAEKWSVVHEKACCTRLFISGFTEMMPKDGGSISSSVPNSVKIFRAFLICRSAAILIRKKPSPIPSLHSLRSVLA